jgi:hypothetical protein
MNGFGYIEITYVLTYHIYIQLLLATWNAIIKACSEQMYGREALARWDPNSAVISSL